MLLSVQVDWPKNADQFCLLRLIPKECRPAHKHSKLFLPTNGSLPPSTLFAKGVHPRTACCLYFFKQQIRVRAAKTKWRAAAWASSPSACHTLRNSLVDLLKLYLLESSTVLIKTGFYNLFNESL